jgi:hypothetical protein
LSLSKKKAVKYVAMGIMASCLFAATIFYLFPNSSHTSSIVFAMSVPDSSSQNSTIYSLQFDLVTTYLNGTASESLGQTAGGLNSTDIEEIQFIPVNSYIGNAGVSGPFVVTFQFAHNYQVLTGVTGETTLGMGTLNVVNYTMTGYAGDYSSESNFTWPANFTVPPRLNYTYQVNYNGSWSLDQSRWYTLNNTGSPPPYWGQPTWTLSADQIQSILANATDTVNIAFNLDMSSIVYYILITPSGTQIGTASVQYSGPWGDLQLFHEGNQLTGYEYSFSNVGLTMTSS